MTRRILTPAEEQASNAWKARMRAEQPARFKGRVVGHLPDAAAGGPVVPPGDKAMALLRSVNSYLGGILGGVPVGTFYNRVALTRTL